MPFQLADLSSLERALNANRGRIAAVALDVGNRDRVPGHAVDDSYPLAPTPEFVQNVAKLTREHGALLIFDEIVAGFRLALGGGQQYYNVTPDLACFAKGIANGMPVTAVCGRHEVMTVAERLIVTTIYGGEALSLAAVAATINELRLRESHDHIWHVGQRLVDTINREATDLGIPFVCGGHAPMSAMWFEGDLESRANALWFHLLKECARQGVLLRRGGPNFITAAHTEVDIDRTITAVREALTTIPA